MRVSVVWIAFLLVLSASSVGAQTDERDLASETAWTFRPMDGEARRLRVPAGGWRLNGFPKATAGTYERRITIPKLAGSGGQVTQLAFEAVNWEAVVSIGPDMAHLQEAGRHLSAWTPFTVDISRFVQPGYSYLLRVAVRDRTYFKDSEGHYTVPAATEWNDRAGRGILRGVRLRVMPETYIADTFVKPDTATNTLSFEVTVTNASRQPQTLTLGGSFAAANAGANWKYPAIPRQAVTVPAQQSRVVSFHGLKWTPGRASWWWPNVPFRLDYRAQLHTLNVALFTPNAQIARHTQRIRFGFCTPGQKEGYYTFNGIRFNLRGDSLPEGTIGTDAFARLPGFLPPKGKNPGWPGSVRDYQRLNYNVIRMHQVPATRYMMDVCDELGMLVIPETAIRGAAAVANITDLPESYTTHLRELILRERNRPSVFKWSLENELRPAPVEFIRKLYDTCMAADGTRPCSIDVNDAGDYPAWPKFAVIDHYSQPPGTPDATGGRPRPGMPIGQGEFVWPEGNAPAGPVWFGLMTRALRYHTNVDVRPYTLLDVWPGVIYGLTPTNFPNPPQPPLSLEQGGRSLLDPVNPWAETRIQVIANSFAPVAAFDRDYDNRMTPSNGQGDWPVYMVALPAGKTVAREMVLFNDEFRGEQLQVIAQPILRSTPTKGERLPPIKIGVRVPLGGKTILPFPLTTPAVPRNTALEVTYTVRKNGEERFRETLQYVLVPENKSGTQVRYEGRDDKTQGNWAGVYGKQGFLVPVKLGRSVFQLPDIYLRRGSPSDSTEEGKSPLSKEAQEQQQAMIDLDKMAASVDDPRVAVRAPGLPERSPAAFLAEGQDLLMRVDTTDGKPHRLSLYLLDYKREGRAVDVDLFDLQGHRLDSRRVGDFGNGTHLLYRFTGTLLVRIKPLYEGDPTLSGMFVDAAPSL